MKLILESLTLLTAMCGLTGIFAFTDEGKTALERISAASNAIKHRGQDAQGYYRQDNIALAHRRLSIIDDSPKANQPLTDLENRFTILFNGEIFNYQQLREKLQNSGVSFNTTSDTEVVLQLYKREGQDFLKKLRGFFALAIFDAKEQSLFLARDRFGEKPLLYYKDSDKFLFGSELGALLELGVPRELDYTSLYQYLQLTYVPAPASMIKGVKKLLPGHAILVKNGKLHASMWYRVPFDPAKSIGFNVSYTQQKLHLEQLLNQSVADRLVADVPVGAFLSGGVDSSIIVGLASQQLSKLNTFSISYPDQPFFDESKYARLVASKFNTEHTEFQVRDNDIQGHLYDMLDSLSEPFADSSALAVYILSKQVGKNMKAVLSGDGADELFGGYNKYLAEYEVLRRGINARAIQKLKLLWNLLPKSRNSLGGNKVRQLQRFAEGASLSPNERYWFWTTWLKENEALELLEVSNRNKAFNSLYHARKNRLLTGINKEPYSLNSVLCADWELVLPNDMLTKIDLMGMGNGLEIRSPFLDHRLVRFAFSLPATSKVKDGVRKRILKDTFSHLLPAEILNRSKKGFEVPLSNLLRSEGKNIESKFFHNDLIKEQGIFDSNSINILLQKALATNNQENQLKLWTLIVFQNWWFKYLA